MRIKKKITVLLVLAVLIIYPATMAFASAQVTISSPAGNGLFDLQGSGFNGVAGTKVTIMYDPATLANPRINQGGLMSGALMAVNANSPGTVILALMTGDAKGFSGSGSIASINFDLPGSSLGVIRSITAELTSAKGGMKIDVQASYSNPYGTKSSPSPSAGDTPTTDTGKGVDTAKGTGSDTVTGKNTNTGTGSGPVVLGGGLNMPGEGDAAKTSIEKPENEVAVEAAVPQKEAPASPGIGGNEAAPPSREAPADASSGKIETAQGKPASLTYKSVLDQFRSYQGPKSPQALVAMFEQGTKPGNRQEPPVVLSDGSTKVKIFINLPSPGKDAPNFAIADAKLESLKMEGETTWVVEVLPAKGVYMAAVRVLHNGALTEIPLTVAPPLPKVAKIGTGSGLTEADFNLFLKETGNAKPPRNDLNGDGKRDYIDDYIFTANYIVSSERGKKVKAKEPK